MLFYLLPCPFLYLISDYFTIPCHSSPAVSVSPHTPPPLPISPSLLSLQVSHLPHRFSLHPFLTSNYPPLPPTILPYLTPPSLTVLSFSFTPELHPDLPSSPNLTSPILPLLCPPCTLLLPKHLTPAIILSFSSSFPIPYHPGKPPPTQPSLMQAGRALIIGNGMRG